MAKHRHQDIVAIGEYVRSHLDALADRPFDRKPSVIDFRPDVFNDNS